MTGAQGARGARSRAWTLAAGGLALAALAAPAAAQTPVPPPIYPVRDDARVLDAATRERLVALCRELSQTTGATAARLRRDPALAVQFTVERLDGLARGWGLGGPAVAPALSFGGGRPGWWGPPPGGASEAPAAAPVPARTREDPHAPPRAPTAREPRAADARGPALGGRGAARGVAVLVLAGWALGLGFLLQQALGLGRLLAPKPALWLLALGGPLAAGGLLFLGVGSRFDAPDVGIAATGAVGGVVGLILTSHICPRCSKWMSITRRTLVSATYSSSGKGERTERCRHCGHSARSTYTIARLQRTTSTSSSSRSSGGSSYRSSGGSSSRGSFGGGSSRGGGGGASW